MNREILFKAKRKNWRELPKEEWWVEGNLITNERQEGTAYIGYIFDVHNGIIEDFDIVEIDPETLCQYIGLTDKNGKRIWENDICIIHSSNIDDEDGYFTIAWDEDRERFILDGNLIVDFDSYYGYECEVIGNIFDKPELLEEV